ncbi:hypothetical protein [Cellulomonas iranensis]|uniref:hypothetical protein n=1 Tax=Cellulomonas iranensis TaxID=76862 RepID=UPI003D7D5E2D
MAEDASPYGRLVIDGVAHYMNVPEAWLPDLGRIAVLSSRIEYAARQLADHLGNVRKVRKGESFGHVCKTSARLLRHPRYVAAVGHRFPPGWRDEALAWLDGAPKVMDDARNGTFHPEYIHMATNDGWVPARKSARTDDPQAVELITASDIADARTQMERLDQGGWELVGGLVQAMQETSAAASTHENSPPHP